MLKCDSSKTIIIDLSMEKGLGRIVGNLNHVRTAARTDLSNHFKYFLLLVVNTNWWYKDGRKLLLRINNCCWGFRGARLMLHSPLFSLPAMSALILIGEKGTPRY